ncbi:hypothetical protein AFK24_04195 [Pseudomonas syringae]|uniref:Uncharacterized protein n=1 Tax=Pseudomonas syringae TaxID=317 RepID=A0A1C7ZCQ5_PSESX|nr:hypothetical protein [Pseudomonas syringae]OCR26328.1 hypothetical protein AFK24_04195 [Pseudomonas syringae]
MREVFKFIALFLFVCTVAVAVTLALPMPDNAVFAAAVLLPAIALALIISIELSEGRINGAGEIMRAIETRQSRRLTLAAYLLGCTLVAATMVLVYDGVFRAQ